MNEGHSQSIGRSGAPAMTLGASSHVGKRRIANEDAFCLLTGGQAPEGTLACVAVADGMGGHRAGEVASNLAIKELTRLMAQRRFLPPAVTEVGTRMLAEDVHAVNREVYRASLDPHLLGMGTTLTAGLIIDATFHVAHVGDSRAYLFRSGHLQRLTKDHSWAEEQVLAGLLSPEEAVSHPGRHVLTRALGVAPNVEVDTATVTLRERDVVLLCSDGLYTQVREAEIAEILVKDEPQTACDRLVESANSQGGRDNITAVIIRLDHLGDASLAHSPVAGAGSVDGKGLRGMLSLLWRAMRAQQ